MWMKHYKGFGWLGIFLCVLGTVFSLQAAAPVASKTLDNLQTSFNGESNAKAKYEAFAEKADAEGYKSVAALFRAAAHSESIHAKKHGEVIKKMGGIPKMTLEKVEVKSTKENLEAAFNGETYEKNAMYPDYMKQAELEKNAAAVRTFNSAMIAEKEHANMYAMALKNLELWKADDKVFLVCVVCGFTTMDQNIKKCPICAAPRSKFDMIK